MVKSAPLIFFAVFFFSVVLPEATSSILHDQPHKLASFQIQNTTSTSNACSYTVAIKTSCSSTSFTRDHISLSFGDTYNGQVHAPRLDNPSSRIFERCSTDTFRIAGPCMRGRICYLNLYRAGSDGWKPDSVKVSYRNRTVGFDFNTFIPSGVWFGFNLCKGGGVSAAFP